MPPTKWSDKDERQYEHVQASMRERGARAKRAKEVAARTVNKTRRQEGRTPKTTTEGTGNPNRSLDDRTRDELYNRAKQLKIRGRSSMDKAALARAIRERE